MQQKFNQETLDSQSHSTKQIIILKTSLLRSCIITKVIMQIISFSYHYLSITSQNQIYITKNSALSPLILVDKILIFQTQILILVLLYSNINHLHLIIISQPMIYLLPQDDVQENTRQILKKPNKTEQEIKKYTLEEDLGQIKRTILILSKGEPIQRKAIIQSLPTIVLNHPNIINQIITIAREIMSSLDSELQNSLVQQIIKLVPMVSENSLSDLTRMTLTHLQQWKNQDLSMEWVKLFQTLIDKSTFIEFEKQAIALTIKLSQSKEILPMKIVSARMIGHLSKIMKNRLKGIPLDRIRAFCRDPDKQLRLTIVKEVMPSLFQNLGIQLINIYFMEKIFQMVYDPNVEIKMASIGLLLEFYNILSMEDKQRYSKIVMEHLAESKYFPQFSKISGQIYMKIRFQLQRKSDMGSFISCFQSHLASQDPIVRYNALYNLPGLLLHMGLKIWSDVKQLYFDILLEDEVHEVKKISVSIFHEIFKIMEFNDFQSFPSVVLSMIKCLNIEAQDILYCFLEGFPLSLEILRRTLLEYECNQKDTTLLDKTIYNVENYVLGLSRALTSTCQKQLKNHYLIAKFHSCLGQCAKFMNIDTMLNSYLPLLCEGLIAANGIVLQPILDSFHQVLFELVGKVQLLPFITEITKLLCQSSSYSKVKYIKLSNKLLTCFSVQKYKELGFLENCIKFTQDAILSVRMELIIYFQEARLYFQGIDKILDKLLDSQGISQYLTIEVKQECEVKKQQKKRRNSECLKNEEVVIFPSKKKIEEQEPKKRNFIIKTAPINYKKNIIKSIMGSKNITSSSTSSHSLVSSLVNTNRSQLKIKINQDTRDISKSIRKIIHNKIISQPQRRHVQKRKFQSVQISLQKSKITEQTRRRRKTIIEKKDALA